MKEKKYISKKILSAVLSLTMLAATLPGNLTFAKDDEEFRLDNGYITAVVSEDNGGFMIRTAQGDKISKEDDDKELLYHSELDDTSFTSFQVTRGGETKEYIFGGEYEGSSDVTVSKENNEMTAVWSVDQIQFTQTLKLVNSGSNEHGMVYISYEAENQGEPADIKARVLLDTALGEQDYAYYLVGGDTIETETTLERDGYDKTFYACDDPFAPQIISYVVNASVADTECKPYQTKVAHWGNLASTVFDCETNKDLTFTNPYNEEYMTADSAVALYYDLGSVAQGATGMTALNYGVFSHENVEAGTQATFDVTAPNTLELTEDMSAYKNDGVFTVVSNTKNISDKTYERVRVVVQATKGIVPVDSEGNEIAVTYDNPYTFEWIEYEPAQIQENTWNFKAVPGAEGVYGKISFQLYDVSDDATLNTGEVMAENLLGEGRTYILCPGSVTKVPAIKFTASTPDTLYVGGERTLNITGENFSMLVNKSEYKMIISRVDGAEWNGITNLEIPSESFSIDELNNTMMVKIDESMPEFTEGRYQITFDYTAADKKDLTAEALQFLVKDDVKYKNDTYGLLAVVKDDTDEDDIQYTVQKFADEAAYSAYLEAGTERDNVLLEFRGKFSLKSENGKNVYTALSKDGEDNVITLNSCLDIEKGTVVVTENDGTVTVDFDANIYTTGSRTSVFKGVCGLTELERGEDYCLIEYDDHGERDEEDDDDEAEGITLLWPSVGQAAQNLLGMLFDFKYGELGVMKNEEENMETRVIAFGASLDLSFVVPEDSEEDSGGSDALTNALNQIAQTPGYSADDLRSVNREIPYNSNTQPRVNTNNNTNTGNNNQNDEEDDDETEFSGSVEINDILFGGKYLGVNFAVEIGVPSLVDGMPDMEAKLEINTIGDWSLGVEGECEFASFALEASITIMSKNNIPIPDSLHFFMGGFVPGINVDGFGILWLQGAGGGIENLYDTVFLKSAVPPLKLIIEAQFSLMQIISARAKLELSLCGIGVELTEGKIANSLEVLENAKLQLNWYPEFYFMSSANLNIEDIVKGGGYIVLEQSGFFEFFVKASVGVPDDVPIVGGMELASVGLGVNTEKIWGQVNVLFIDFGIIYYWGGDFEWGGGVEAEPTYPDLLADSSGIIKDVPVYHDDETGRTLYARVGTNLKKMDTRTVSQDEFISSELYMADTGSGVPVYSENVLQTNYNGSEYRLTLAPKKNSQLLTVEWTADSLETAQKQAKQFKITNMGSEGGSYDIKYLTHGENAETQNANANVTYDSETGKATMCVSFSKETDFNKQWKIEVGDLKDVQMTLYDVEAMPKLSDSATKFESDKTDSSKVQLTLKGTKLNEFTNISVFAKKKDSGDITSLIPANLSLQSLVSQPKLIMAAANGESTENEEGTLVYYEEKPEGYQDGDVITFDMPKELESGEYDIQVVAKDSDEEYNSSVDFSYEYDNKYAPKAVRGLSDVKNAGDYLLQLTVQKPDKDDFDGYAVTVYDENGKEVSGLSDMMFNGDGSDNTYNEDGTIATVADKPDGVALTVGGQYSYTDESTGKQVLVGLEAGKAYQLGIRTWKLTEEGNRVLSGEKRTGLVTVKEPVQAQLTFASETKSVLVKDSRTTASGEAIAFETPMYADSNLTFTVTADTDITGKWKLDNGETEGSTGTFDQAGKKIKISLQDVSEGTHMLTVYGTNENGDSFRQVYTFGVDTLAPRMLLSAPTSGTIYADGILGIAGVTDADAKLTVVDETTGKKLMDVQTVSVDEEGRFSTSVVMDDTVAFHKITVMAADALGNMVTKQLDVVSAKLGQIDSLALYANGEDVTNKYLDVDKSYDLQLMAKIKDGSVVKINNESMIDWQKVVMEGAADVDVSGEAVTLTTSADSCGMVTARYLVNSAGAYSVSAAFTAETKDAEPGASENPETSAEPGASKVPVTSAEPGASKTPVTSEKADGTAVPGKTERPDDVKTSETAVSVTEKNTTVSQNPDAQKADSGRKADSSKTGDTVNLVLPVCLLFVSGGTAVVLFSRRKKKERTR